LAVGVPVVEERVYTRMRSATDSNAPRRMA
jgi:hypothetical protein